MVEYFFIHFQYLHNNNFTKALFFGEAIKGGQRAETNEQKQMSLF